MNSGFIVDRRYMGADSRSMAIREPKIAKFPLIFTKKAFLPIDVVELSLG